MIWFRSKELAVPMKESNSGYPVWKPGMSAGTFNASTREMDTGGPSRLTCQPGRDVVPRAPGSGRDVVPQNSMENNEEDM